MKILLLTPLFPPDTGDPASYVKDLATRLSGHEVTLLIYGRLPEAVPNIKIISIDKRQWLPLRLLKYTKSLWQNSEMTDLIIVNNAPSTELPALFVSTLRPRTMHLCESDSIAKVAAQSGMYKIIHQLLKKRCQKTIGLPDDKLHKKPEVLPFIQIDETVHARRERWWNNHLNELTSL